MKTVNRKHVMVSAEMDLKPFMNLMVVLIPMLLLSAEFANVAIVDVQLPKDRGITTENPDPTRDPQELKKLKLTAILTDSFITLGAKGGFLPSIRYKEFHHYVAKDDQTDFTVAFIPGKMVNHPKTGRKMSPQERQDINLYVCDDNRRLLMRLYNSYGEVATDESGVTLDRVIVGDTVYFGCQSRRMMVVDRPGVLVLQPLSAYDELKNRLVKIKRTYGDAEDRESIIIAAGNEVVYDKIIQVMDRAREADFPQISVSKLRG